MRLPLRASLAVVLSAALALILATFIPPFVIGKEAYAKGHGRSDALAAAAAFSVDAKSEGLAAGLLPAYASRYPNMDFELLSSELRVVASSRPGPSRYTLAQLIERLSSDRAGEEDAELFFRELSGASDASYLLVRLRSPFSISLTRPAIEFIGRALLVVVALALLVFALVLAAFSLPYARRVSRLAAAIVAYEPGSPPIASKGGDETTVIAEAFNEMAVRLAAAQESRRLEEQALRREEEARREEELQWRSSVANLSHDLRTPLASVLAYSESLERSAYSGEEERSRYEAIIHAKALYMTGLLDSLLEYARLGVPSRAEESAEIDLCELARGIVIEYLDEAERRGLSVEAEIPEGPILVRARPEGISRALRNLMDNALTYGSSKRPLEVGLEKGPLGAQGAAALSVRDYGPGISEGERERVFERYYRVDRGRGSETGGLGLGLTIARAIARAEGGELTLENPEGGGCRFILTLPLSSS